MPKDIAVTFWLPIAFGIVVFVWVVVVDEEVVTVPGISPRTMLFAAWFITLFVVGVTIGWTVELN